MKMAIIRSCCFWKSLRKGCFASAIYTLVYYFVSCIAMLMKIFEELDYITGKSNELMSDSVLSNTPTNLWFSMMMLGGVVLGIISSILVLIGLRKDQREFLAPFILIMSLNIFLEISYFIVMTMIGSLKFDPVTSTLFTVDFFILCLNTYCLVCVISQYQEYKEYRCGKDFTINNGAAGGSATPEKSCIVLHQSRTSPNNGHTNVTIIQESHLNGSATIGVLTKSPFQRRNNRSLLKKQVKFTDDLNCTPDILTTIVHETKDKDKCEKDHEMSNENDDKKKEDESSFKDEGDKRDE